MKNEPLKKKPLWWCQLVATLMPHRRLRMVEGDMLPSKLATRRMPVSRR
jgi:hypothetical protein